MILDTLFEGIESRGSLNKLRNRIPQSACRHGKRIGIKVGGMRKLEMCLVQCRRMESKTFHKVRRRQRM